MKEFREMNLTQWLKHVEQVLQMFKEAGYQIEYATSPSESVTELEVHKKGVRITITMEEL